MEYCQSTLPFAACISMNVMTYFPALLFLVSAVIVNKKKSFIYELRRKQEFEENPQMIQRSKINKMVKQVVTLTNFLVCFVFLFIYAQEPIISIVVLAFYGIQASIFIASVFILQSEYKRQGQNSLITISNYVVNFFIQAGMGIFIKLENTVDTHCFALLIILQATSLVTSSCIILMRNDFTKESMQIQSKINEEILQKQNSIRNNLINQSCNQSTFQQPQNQTNVNDITATTVNNLKKNQKSSVNGNSFKDFSIVDIQNVSNTDINNYKRTQSANTSNRSDAGEGRDNRFTPSFSQNSAKQSTVSNNEEEPKAYLYAYHDVKVIGYKAKDNQMLFVITYFRGVKQYKTDRSHRDFKYLGFQLTNELAKSNLTLPSLPQRIQKTGVLDKKVLKDKMTKYNRFLYYIEYNKIDSNEFSQFLLSNKELPIYAPASSKTNSDIQSFVSSPSESVNNSITESFKLSPKNNSPKSHSTIAFSRVSSESISKIKNELLNSQFNIEPISENINEQNYDQEDETPSNKSTININNILLFTQSQNDNDIQMIQENLKKDITAKDSTDSASTATSNTLNRNKNRSQTTKVVSNTYDEKIIPQSRQSRQIEQNNNYSFMTQSEKLSIDTQKFDGEERIASALSEGQETQLLIENSQNSKAFNKQQSLFNSISQEDTNITSQNNKSSVFSFSQKSQIDQQVENVFFKSPAPQAVKPDYQMIIIPQTKEMNGKTFYEIEFYLNGKKVYNVDKRYNNFKEFHLTMKSELKKSNQIQLLPELPYKPSNKSPKNLIEYRKNSLALYLTKLQQTPVIYNSPIYKKFIEQS